MSEQALEDSLTNARAELELALTNKVDAAVIYQMEAYIDDLEDEVAMLEDFA